jgi:hypothetical protein
MAGGLAPAAVMQQDARLHLVLTLIEVADAAGHTPEHTTFQGEALQLNPDEISLSPPHCQLL